ncbi:hypothetical protein BBI09_01395 [Stutzerimonas xanthomarina]|nr:hypothetical protein BBI09_01395 [Stutzerimonas xanthomarina]HCL74501.1 hypothetical protein [Pseudomonas sp.]
MVLPLPMTLLSMESGTYPQDMLPDSSSVKIIFGGTPTVRLKGLWETAAFALAALSRIMPKTAYESVLA